jgi:tRNA (mo5U34)-methyltransferase
MSRSAQLSDIQREAVSTPWFHSIEIAPGVFTPGHKTPDLLRNEADAIFGPLNIKGGSILDVGAWDGFFSVEAKRRGAVRVLSTDKFAWFEPRIAARRHFEIARQLTDSDVEDLVIDAPELTVDRVGQFDYVLFLGVFYHLINPVQVLQNLSAIVRQTLVVETHLDLRYLPWPAMRFYPGAEVNNDPTNWWGPNRLCVEKLLLACGFSRVTYRRHPDLKCRNRGIFHACK